MSEALGRVERPAADLYQSRRKLFVVFLVFTHESAPAEYKERCERYWQQVDEQLTNLESKTGAARHIYHESVYEMGEAGLASIEQVHPYSHSLAKQRCENGAILEAMEDKDLAAELSDWERFIVVGFASSKVGDLVRDLYMQALKKHNEHVVQAIDATLGPAEAGILFMREGHGLQFPRDIEVFSVVPPALDELHRWLRDQSRQHRQQETTEQEGEAEPVEADSSEREG